MKFFIGITPILNHQVKKEFKDYYNRIEIFLSVMEINSKQNIENIKSEAAFRDR